MKKCLYALVLLIVLGNTSFSLAQCPVPNKDFNGYWIVSTLINFADTYDPAEWTSTRITGENAFNYFESGLFPAPGTTSQMDAVEFYLQGPLVETGIRTLNPIVCSNFPTSVTGHFKHLGTGSDTLFFTIDVSDVDVWGDTTKEVLTAELVCNTLISNAFQSFEIPMPLPHLSVYTQIDTLEIAYRSVSFDPGSFILDDLDFGYTSSVHENKWAQSIRVSPTITHQNIEIGLPKPLPGLEINLVDAIGRTLISKRFNAEEALSLDLGELAAGVYFIQCNHPKEQIHLTRKVVKM